LKTIVTAINTTALLDRTRHSFCKTLTYVGLDVHKDTIAVALAKAGADKDVREYGKIMNTPTG